jgi:hypothetical protein
MAGPPTTIAWFSNYGERGKREKRYGWKPDSQAQYDLVLSNDGSERTKWTLNETNSTTKARTPVRTGHLWVCEEYHPSYSREVGFKDCPRRVVPYDAAEVGLTPVRNRVASFASHITSLASYVKGTEEEANETMAAQDGPIWISCTSGCCTLGR